ncbi:tagaturonate reductase [Flavobacterium sp. NRK F10]|uniref:tagaturonate reductase n=1 Tax=Flavobacterium sp. NRK F10 TaxID=2954931 RepID=UPI002091AC63|nr:tagaturonate reductase [Flavobacterium sp. NRK F10]MCO6176271.1 tagaturonate reductase [Flavobacterium sp. NRK F10]
MKRLNRKNTGLTELLPVKVVQFGEGNFLRAFVDYAFQQLNKTVDFNVGVAVVQPLANGLVPMLNDQDGLYTLFLNGVKKGEKIQDIELVSNIVKGINPYSNFEEYLKLAHEESLEFIISNTTEAGIEFIETDTADMAPPQSFPAKLTVLLLERFKHFKGDASKGLTIIPCELINYNSDTLKEIILKYIALWNLGQEFENWILNACTFHNTLVDRIVPGYPKDDIENYNNKLDYHDNLIVTAEPFFLWVIEGDDKLKEKLPFHKTNLDVKIVADMQPYRTRKVRILNGAHTAMVPFSLMYGNETVRETIENPFTFQFVNTLMFDEINETLDMDRAELESFTNEVLDRFRNPFIKHLLSDIALNTISKFKVRVLPSLLQYQARFEKLPLNLTFAFACMIRFYKGEWKNGKLPIKDNAEVVAFFEQFWQENSNGKPLTVILKNEEFWDQDLTKVEGLQTALEFVLDQIEANGLEQAYKNFLNEYKA